MPTRSINKIHFDDLSPIRFEDLCMNLVSRLRVWKELNHYGRKGTDGGIDIYASEEIKDELKTWHIQCKRYTEIRKSDLTAVIDNLKGSKPDKLLLIISCDLRRELFEYFKNYASSLGILEADIWTASNLETELYNKHKDLLFVYFGIQISRTLKTNEAKIKHNLRMKKRMERDFIEKDWFKKYRRTNDPTVKFKWSQVYIRSIDDDIYPECLETSSRQISTWFKIHLYDFYHNGLELWIGAAAGHKVIMDKKGYWESLTDHFDERQNDTKYRTINVKAIGQIPYHVIVDYDLNGDEYSSEPHIFCKFQFNGEPYEKIYYKFDSRSTDDQYDWDLEDEKETKFPKE